MGWYDDLTHRVDMLGHDEHPLTGTEVRERRSRQMLNADFNRVVALFRAAERAENATDPA